MKKWPARYPKEVPGFIVIASDIPPRYWADHGSAWQVGDPRSRHDRARIEFGQGDGPDNGYASGGLTPDMSSEVLACYYAWIPAKYVEPEVNDFGEVAP